MHVEWIATDDRARVQSIWEALCAAAQPSYFQSWGWIRTWLASLPPRHGVRLCVIWTDGRPAGGFFLGSSWRRRNHVIVSATKHINATGDEEIDDLCAEFTSFLWAVEQPPPTLRTMLDRIPGLWDELYMMGLDAERFPGDALASPGWPYRLDVVGNVPSYFVDLDKVRAHGDYLALLGAKTRSQLRRTHRLYATDGEITVEAPTVATEQLVIYRELVELHQRHWTGLGFAGAFATEYFRRFHERLIRDREGTGEVQLFRVRVAGKTVGILYGFNYGGTFHLYQTGMAFHEDRRTRRPGYLCNAEAIKYYAAAGLRRYDFLAGKQPYKRQLSTGVRNLVSVRVQKVRLRFWIERNAKRIRDEWRVRRSQTSNGNGPNSDPADSE